MNRTFVIRNFTKQRVCERCLPPSRPATKHVTITMITMEGRRAKRWIEHLCDRCTIELCGGLEDVQ